MYVCIYVLTGASVVDLVLWLSYLTHLSLRQNPSHFADGIFRCIFLNEDVWILLKFSLKFVLKVQINNIPALVQIMASYQLGDKPLCEPMMVSLLMNICVTQPQWVNEIYCVVHTWIPYFCDKLLFGNTFQNLQEIISNLFINETLPYAYFSCIIILDELFQVHHACSISHALYHLYLGWGSLSLCSLISLWDTFCSCKNIYLSYLLNHISFCEVSPQLMWDLTFTSLAGETYGWIPR